MYKVTLSTLRNNENFSVTYEMAMAGGTVTLLASILKSRPSMYLRYISTYYKVFKIR